MGQLVSEAGGAETDLPRFTRGFNKMDIRHRGPLGQACAGDRPHFLIEGHEAGVAGDPVSSVIARRGVQEGVSQSDAASQRGRQIPAQRHAIPLDQQGRGSGSGVADRFVRENVTLDGHGYSCRQEDARSA